jgi:adenine-specific DNA-methyltransferase
LLASRVHLSKNFLSKNGVLCATIDDVQQKELAFLLDHEFGNENFLGSVSIRINPSGRVTLRGFAQCHEYGIFYGNSQNSAIAKLARSDAQLARFNQADDFGSFEWRNFRREGSASERYSRPKRFFPIYVSDDGYRIPSLRWNDSITAYDVLEEPESNETVMYPVDSQGTERVWRWGLERIAREGIEVVPKVNQRGHLQIYYKYRPNAEGVLPQTMWFDKKYSATENGTALLKALFSNRNEFSFPKAIGAVEDSVRIMLGDDNEGMVLDYFAGSGTTGHAVLNLNREDGGHRKYILVEQGEYFNSVTKPRIQKCVYSPDWSKGQPLSERSGASHCFKVLKLESYEDTLNNLKLRRDAKQNQTLGLLDQQAKDDYLLHYMLDVESRGSLLSVEDFKKPFDYSMNIAVDSAGAFERTKVDVVETFNYLIGLRVKHMDAQPERGFVNVTGTLPSGESCLVLWRDCDVLDYEGVTRLCDKLAINPADNEYDVVYINGDHNIPTVLTQTEEEGGSTRVLKLRQIEPEFLERMFSVEDV